MSREAWSPGHEAKDLPIHIDGEVDQLFDWSVLGKTMSGTVVWPFLAVSEYRARTIEALPDPKQITRALFDSRPRQLPGTHAMTLGDTLMMTRRLLNKTSKYSLVLSLSVNRFPSKFVATSMDTWLGAQPNF